MNLWHGIISKARIKQIVRKEPRKNNITHSLFGKMLQFLKFISIQEAHPGFVVFFYRMLNSCPFVIIQKGRRRRCDVHSIKLLYALTIALIKSCI